MTAKRIALLLLAVCLSGAAHAQGKAKGREAVSARIDAIVASRLAEWHSPGMAVAVIRRGNVVHAKGYGEKTRGR